MKNPKHLTRWIVFSMLISQTSLASTVPAFLPCQDAYTKRRQELERKFNFGWISGSLVTLGASVITFETGESQRSTALGQNLRVAGYVTAGLAYAIVPISVWYGADRLNSLERAAALVEQTRLGDEAYAELLNQKIYERELENRKAELAKLNRGQKRQNRSEYSIEEYLTKNPIDRSAIAESVAAYIVGPNSPVNWFSEQFFPEIATDEVRRRLESELNDDFLCSDPANPRDAHMISRELKRMYRIKREF